MFDKSKWIWYTAQAEDDTYGEFYAPLQCREGEKTVLRISCDGDYALYINGTSSIPTNTRTSSIIRSSTR